MSIHRSTPFALAFSAIVVKSWMSLPQNEFPKLPQPGPPPAPGGRGN